MLLTFPPYPGDCGHEGEKRYVLQYVVPVVTFPVTSLLENYICLLFWCILLLYIEFWILFSTYISWLLSLPFSLLQQFSWFSISRFLRRCLQEKSFSFLFSLMFLKWCSADNLCFIEMWMRWAWKRSFGACVKPSILAGVNKNLITL